MSMTEYERGWLEAAIDGEGCFGLGWNGSSKYVTRLVLVNTNKEFLQKAQRILGSGAIKYTPKNPPRKGVFYLTVFANTLRKVLPELNLTVKEPHRKAVLEAVTIIGRNNHRHYLPEDRKRLEQLVFEMKGLNRKGVDRV